MKVLLYTRRGCHLCERVEEMLAFHAPTAVTIDVGTSPDLEHLFGTRVPVLEVNGRIAAEGQIDEQELLWHLGRPGTGALTKTKN